MSTYPYKYFSGANITIKIEEDELDCAGLSFVLNESQQPAYGYASTHYDMILAGRVLVQGSFVLNFSEENAFYDLIGSKSLELNDPNVFDIHIKYNNMNKNKKDLIIKDCFLISRGQSIQISDQAILEEYSFIGRELVSNSFNNKLEKIANDAKAAAEEAKRKAERKAELDIVKEMEEYREKEEKEKESKIEDFESKEKERKAKAKLIEFELLFDFNDSVKKKIEIELYYNAFDQIHDNIKRIINSSNYLEKHEAVKEAYKEYLKEYSKGKKIYLYEKGYDYILKILFDHMEEYEKDVDISGKISLAALKYDIENSWRKILSEIKKYNLY